MKTQSRRRGLYDRNASNREVVVGEEVTVLLPSQGRLLAHKFNGLHKM